MDYAIILFFDKNTEDKINVLIQKIAQNNGNNYMVVNKIPPHLSISLFGYDNPINSIIKLIDNNISEINIQNIYFASIGIFNPNVLFLSPVIDNNLLELNRYMNKLLKNNNVNKFDQNYLENQWVPHMSLGVKLNEKELLDGLNVLINNYQNINARINRIALVECNPYKEIKIWNV
jgi:2'-5' RNA ligase